MLEVLQGYQGSTNAVLNTALAVGGVKAAYDTFNVPSGKDDGASQPQLVALVTGVLHALLNIFALLYADVAYVTVAQSLACVCGSVLVGMMEYMILGCTNGALFFACSLFRGFVIGYSMNADFERAVTLQAITFGMMFFINHCARTSAVMTEILASHMIALIAFSVAVFVNQPTIGYVLPTLICAFRAHKVMSVDHQALYRAWMGGEMNNEIVEEVVETVEEDTTDSVTDDDAWAPQLGADVSEELPAGPALEQSPSSFEEQMIARLAKLRKGSNTLDRKCDERVLDLNRKEFAPTGKSYEVPASGPMNAAPDADPKTRDRNNKDRIESVKAGQAANEAYQNKMDAHHQAQNNIQGDQPLTPPAPTVRHGSVHADMKLQFNWDRVGGTTLRPSSSGKALSDMEKLKKMKMLQLKTVQERIMREENCPGTAAPQLGKATTAADNAALAIKDTTKIIGGVSDGGLQPALNRAVATPDQEALKEPETAKMSNGIIRIRANVLYEQMRAMLHGSEAEVEALTAQVECCKTIIFRLKAEIIDRKREAGIQRTMAFMDRHSWAEEQALKHQAGEQTDSSSCPAPDTLDGTWTVMHHNGDIHMSLEQEEDGMICGDARDFLENVSGKYDPDTRGFCMRIDIGPHVFQLVQGEMVSDFGIVMLRNFSNGVELPTEFCIMIKSPAQSEAGAERDYLEDEASSDDASDDGWYNDFETTVKVNPEAPNGESPTLAAQPEATQAAEVTDTTTT